MQDDIKIEYTSNTTGPKIMWWVDIHMTNKRGTEYRAIATWNGINKVHPIRHVFNDTNDTFCTMKNAPKWVKKTIEEQLPIVAIMLS